MPKSPADRTPYQWAPHSSTPRRAAWEGMILVVIGLLCAMIALEALVV